MFGRIIACLVLCLSFFAVMPAKATTPEDVARVVRLIRDPSTPNIVDRKIYNDGGVRVVFTSGNVRYTFVHRRGELTIWARPDGTSDKEFVATFTDENLDGVVDEGVGGGKFFFPFNNKGVEYLPFWQRQYSDAVWAAIQTLRE